MEVIKLKKRKLITSLVLSCSILFGVSSSASAVSITLYDNQTSVTSGAIGLQSSAYMSSNNEWCSKHKVYTIANKANPGQGYVLAGKKLMDIGQPGHATYDNGSGANWTVELNPRGWLTIGCVAHGSIQ